MARNPFVTMDPMPPTAVAAAVLRGGYPLALDVFVCGTPRPKGSKDYKGRRGNGSAILVESADVAPWASEVARAARAAGVRVAGPVRVDLEFVVRRPRKIANAMTGLGRSVGDGDKLTRAVWDALTEAGVIEDDSRVVQWSGSKRLAGSGEPTGVRIKVRGIQNG
jgi:crossover junction endodeoxyribonuclease RusA